MNYEQQDEHKTANSMLKWHFGPELCALFEDDTVIEIILNSDGKLWVERLGQRMEEIGTMGASQAESLMGILASLKKEVITEKNPRLSCELPDEFAGARFQGHIPPVVKNPAFTIRKKAIAVFTLEQYTQEGIMTQVQREIIETAVRDRKNILIAGSTGSGKTTLTNAVIRYVSDVCPDDRIVIIEDTRELQCSARNAEKMLVTPEITMSWLIKDSLRMCPSRLLVGEVRDGAALDLLMGWNTGHPGISTLHSNSAEDALDRMQLLVAMASAGPMQSLIAKAVNLIVFIEKCSGSRRIKEIVRVTGFDGQRYLTQPVGDSNE
jgi:P-type conjugative transfer ATPase TrbB